MNGTNIKERLSSMDSQQILRLFNRTPAGGGVSNAIRWLISQGYTRSQVANMLDLRYQHVRNVDITPLKKKGIVPPQMDGEDQLELF
jgi:hypothetical protein